MIELQLISFAIGTVFGMMLLSAFIVCILIYMVIRFGDEVDEEEEVE